MSDLQYQVRPRDEHFASDDRLKPIMSLDGDGLRGIATTAFLEKSKRFFTIVTVDTKAFGRAITLTLSVEV